MKFNNKNYDYLIVGAGPFGCVWAHEAAKAGFKVLIIEKRNHIGGNCYTYKEEGVNVHKYGAHIFHTDKKEIWDYVNEFTDFNGYINQVIANYNGQLFNLPFNMNTFYQMWGTKTPDEAKKKIEQQKLDANISGLPRNLEEQAISLVGTDIYEKLIKGYTEKQWGREAKDLPSFIIKRLPVRFTFDNNYFNHRYQGIPIDGYTKLFENMLASDLIDVLLEVDFLENKETFINEFPKIIYTGMIDQFFNYKFGELEYRSVRFETKVIDSSNYQGNAVINYTDSSTQYTRIMEWKHFDQKSVEGKTVITKEYPQEWNKDREAYYPINDSKNNDLFKKYVKESKKQHKVIFGGRLGNYQYYDMDMVISMALKSVKKELEN